jgi:hypothetical protein
MTASLVSTGLVGILMHPRFFRARWEAHEAEWVELPTSKLQWVAQYGELFDTYTENREGYIVVELLTSMTVGALQSYQALQTDCDNLLWAGMVVYNAYTVSQLVLRPNKNRHVQIFYTAIAGLQATALTAQAIASATASDETQQTVRTVTQSIVMAAEYLMLLKTLFDIGLRFKGWYEHFYQSKRLHPLVKLSAPVTPIISTSPLIEMQSLLTDSETSSKTPPGRLTPVQELGIEFTATSEELFEPSPVAKSFEELLTDAEIAYEESRNADVEL